MKGRGKRRRERVKGRRRGGRKKCIRTDSWRVDRPSASAQSHVPAVIAGTLGSGLQGQ